MSDANEKDDTNVNNTGTRPRSLTYKDYAYQLELCTDSYKTAKHACSRAVEKASALLTIDCNALALQEIMTTLNIRFEDLVTSHGKLVSFEFHDMPDV